VLLLLSLLLIKKSFSLHICPSVFSLGRCVSVCCEELMLSVLEDRVTVWLGVEVSRCTQQWHCVWPNLVLLRTESCVSVF